MSDSVPGPSCIYCAGPLFNQAERDEMSLIADHLCEAGYCVYLPHRDGMEFRHVHLSLIEQGWEAPAAGRFLHQAIFALDIFQLVEQCTAVVWNMNGRVPDEGAVSEAAIAWTLGKPLVAYKEDVRSLIAGRDNPLLAGLVEFQMVHQLADITPALKVAFCRTELQGPASAPLMPAVATAVRQGRELWKAMQQPGVVSCQDSLADVVAGLFAPSPRPGHGTMV